VQLNSISEEDVIILIGIDNFSSEGVIFDSSSSSMAMVMYHSNLCKQTRDIWLA
jgi:hypothetical protein